MALDKSAAAIESDIDSAPKTHPLVSRPYTHAVFYLLGYADAKGAFDSHYLEMQDRALTLSHTINALKYALRWTGQFGPPRDAPLDGLMPSGYDEAAHLLEQATAYLLIVAAYSWAHRGLIDLSAKGHELTIAFRRENDTRYEAYDMLTRPSVEPGHHNEPPDPAIIEDQIARCFDRNLVLGSVPLARNVWRTANRFASDLSRGYYLLPPSWDVGGFTLADFRAVNDAIRAVVFSWRFATDMAAAVDSAYPRFVPFKIRRRELISGIKDVTGLSKEIVQRVVSLLTYSRENASESDPALRPLIAIGQDVLLSAQLVLGASPERNLIALLNTMPAEKARYDQLKNDKERVMRERLASRLPKHLRVWHGKVRRDLPDIDCAIVDDFSHTVLITELKWFVEPDETRELADRSEDIRKGVKQCKSLEEAYRRESSILAPVASKITDVVFAVVSANAIGMAYVQDEDVAVINEEHLLHALDSGASLQNVNCWLRQRRYLPVRNRDFEDVEPTVSFFDWQLTWYGFRPLVKDRYMPLP